MKKTLLLKSISLQMLKLLCLTLLSAYHQSLNGQELQEFFVPALWSYGELNVEQQNRYDRIQNSEPTANYLIDIQNLALTQLTGKLKVTAPNNPCGTGIFLAKQVEYYSENEYLWQGELIPQDSCTCNVGDLLIQSKNGEKYGILTYGEKWYNIEDVSGGKNVLVEQESTEDAGCGVTDDDYSGLNFQEKEGINQRGGGGGGGNCVIDVLIIHTSEAALEVNSAPNQAETSINVTNTALSKSAIGGNGSIKLNLIGQTYNTIIDETGKDMHQMLDEIQDPASDIPQTRDFVNADLVVVFVDRSIMNTNVVEAVGSATPYCPIDFCGSFSQKFAYSVVDVKTAQKKGFLFSHELGHLIGAQHETCDADDAIIGSCLGPANPNEPRRAHTWSRRCGNKNLKRKTIMFSSSTSSVYSSHVIQHYSNPAIKYEKKPTGIIYERDNVDFMEDAACVVAGFRNSSGINDFEVSIVTSSGFTNICENSGEEVSAIISGAPGVYDYEWYESNDGINWGNTQGTSNVYNVDPSGYPPGSHIYIRVKVTSFITQEVKYAYITLLVLSAQDQFCIDIPFSGGNPGFLITSPNPSTGVFDIDFQVLEKSHIKIDLIDPRGRLVKNVIDDEYGIGSYKIPYRSSGHEKGLYYIRYISKAAVLTQTLFIKN